MHTQEVSKLCAHTGGFQALCYRKSSVHTQEVSKLCAHTGGFRALCTHRRIPGSEHTQEDSKLCAHTGGLLVKNRVFELSNCTSLISSGFYTFQTYSR